MWYVYFLRSRINEFIYIGSTDNVERRYKEHNDGKSQSTRAYRPFALDAYIAVQTELKARELEKYFKTGSEKAVLKRRILSDEALIA
jgi:predicted GIY-YIG superfamily endonuclease